MKPHCLMLRSAMLFCASVLGLSPFAACAADTKQTTVYIEEMTSAELRALVAAGTTTILVPVGGTEQNGPHMVLGKHNVRARILAGMIAQRLGNAVVAPVIAYVPQGAINPPQGHMRFAGTISISEPTFEALLEATARSFKQHGFRDVVFLGDHGGYQLNQERVAAKLNRKWAADPDCKVHALRDYYKVTQTVYTADLRKRGFVDREIGTHAGLADTSLTLAIDATLVRRDALAAKPSDSDGVHGDPRRATAELGQIGVQRIVESSVAAIRAVILERDKANK